jgi:hypothetical protein
VEHRRGDVGVLRRHLVDGVAVKPYLGDSTHFGLE